jgi:kinesin family protein 15
MELQSWRYEGSGSAIRNITDWDDEVVVGQSSAGVSSIQSFELCEDPSFWKDHNVQVQFQF